MDIDLPTGALMDRWEDIETDLEATAADLETDGWTTVTLHAGDVTTRPDGDPPALEVLVPGNEFDAVEAHLERGAAFTETAVYRSAAGGVAFLACVLRDPAREVAVLLPAFYPQRGRAVARLADHARAAGTVNLRIRPLSAERVVAVAIDEPELLFPEKWT